MYVSEKMSGKTQSRDIEEAQSLLDVVACSYPAESDPHPCSRDGSLSVPAGLEKDASPAYLEHLQDFNNQGMVCPGICVVH